MNRFVFVLAFALGLAVVAWVGAGFVGASVLALLMTAAIAAVYLLGAWEVRQFRAATGSLAGALAHMPEPVADLGPWLARIHPSLHNAVRLRIEGERAGLPGPALTPYLVGLLVMLGMLGTFLGMVVTFKGAVFALEGSADLHAIRAALAAPIKGLGLSFGTSVAGVAASAMLGLMSALARRERVDAARLLDTRIATVLRPHSLVHQRQETFKALQSQAHALPAVAHQLQALMDGLERRSEQLGERLQAQQAQFHREARDAYTALAASVGRSLQDSLASSAKQAGESLQPVVESAMARIAQESSRMHQRQVDAAQAQLDGLAARLGATAGTVAEGWTTALAQHASTSERLAQGLDRSLEGFTQGFEARAGALLASVQASAVQAQADQAEGDRQRLAAWTAQLASMAATVQAGHQAACLQLEKTAGEITERTGAQAGQAFDGVARLLAQSEALVRARIDSEAQWVQQQGERMEQLAGVWRTGLAALREEEAARGQAAVERLGELQQALAGHLAGIHESVARLQAGLAEADRQRLAAWTAQLETVAATVQAGQQAACQQLEKVAGEIAERTSTHAGAAFEGITRLLAQSEALVRTRIESEAQWMGQQGERMDQLASVWRTELAALRDDEAARGDAAVARLGELEAALAGHLATLGTALEVPLARLLQTASEVPQAAAEVITQLRQEMTRMSERDNLALEERSALVAQINALLQALQQTSGAQGAAIESLVASASAVLEQAGSEFRQSLEAQAGQAAETAVQLSVSAVELSSLGEAFHQGLGQFSASQDKLADSLQRIEASLQQAMARSDEQLAYYVAQAREVIDLSISAQQGIVEDLRRLRSEPEGAV